MKKIIIAIFLLFISISLYAQRATFKTGDAFAFSLTDYFVPNDIRFTWANCTVTSIKKVEKDLWCISLAAFSAGQTNLPVVYEYYVKAGDSIKMRRFDKKTYGECLIKIESIDWNEIVIEIK